MPKLDLHDLKRTHQKNSTSTLAPEKSEEYKCVPQRDGLFGHYTLIDDRGQLIGNMYVYNSNGPKNWRYDNKEDELVELELLAGDYQVLGTRIGQSYAELVKSLKAQKHFHYKKGSTVYSEIDGYWYNFNIKNDKISSIKVQRDCQ